MENNANKVVTDVIKVLDNVSLVDVLDMIDIEKVEMGYYDFISLFFELTTMKISQYQKDSYQNKIASENLKYLVKKTGFKRFMIESKNFTYEDH